MVGFGSLTLIPAWINDHMLNIPWDEINYIFPNLLTMGFSMMTSSNRYVFRVTGLCEGNPLLTVEFPSQRPVTRSIDVFFDLRLNGSANNRDAGDLRHHRSHYDVTVMSYPFPLLLNQAFHENIYHMSQLRIENITIKNKAIQPISYGTCVVVKEVSCSDLLPIMHILFLFIWQNSLAS